MSANPKDVFALARAGLETEANHMLGNVRFSDFTDEEVALLVAFLRPVYERYNPSDWPEPVLRVVSAEAGQ